MSSRRAGSRQEVYELYPSDYDTRSTTSKTTTIRVVKPNLESGSLMPRLLLLLWAFFMIVGWILLVAAFSTAAWVEGTESTGVAATPFLKREVGVFRQCNTLKGGSSGEVEDCFDAGFSNANISEWEAAGALFVVGIIILSITIVLAIVAAIVAWGMLVPVAKVSMFLANLFFIIAILLVPLGFDELDNPCPSTGDPAQCGLSCRLDTDDMDMFVLCAPYELATGTFLCVAALIIIFLSSCCAACVRTV